MNFGRRRAHGELIKDCSFYCFEKSVKYKNTKLNGELRSLATVGTFRIERCEKFENIAMVSLEAGAPGECSKSDLTVSHRMELRRVYCEVRCERPMWSRRTAHSRISERKRLCRVPRPGETESDLPKSFRENRKFQIRNGVLFISLSLKSMLIILTSNTKQAHSSIPKFADWQTILQTFFTQTFTINILSQSFFSPSFRIQNNVRLRKRN